MHHVPQWLLTGLALCLASALAHAELGAIVAVEPTAQKSAHTILRSALESGLSQAAAQPVVVSTSDDLANVMRATRSAGYDIFIAPPQVAASALQRGYELVGATQKSDQYLLVGAAQVATTAALKGRRLYLPQQDSVYTYLARGMLNEAGLSFKDLKAVQHEKYPQAGLTALVLGMADATVVHADDWAPWSQAHPGVARVLGRSQPVPGGLSIAVRKNLPLEVRARLAQWFGAPPPKSGLAPVAVQPSASEYQRLAELGLFTPAELPGVQRITAKEALQLQSRGALVVDTRTDKEFKDRRIRGAVHAAYVEKSLKDVAFDAAQDDFAALARVARLTPETPVVFACNGAECWKSYKAAKVAAGKGFKAVYWLRGGLPEWDAEGLPTDGG
ncbi:sulfurtransferase [Acidovorax sp. SRB_14]|uniref:rhodanese-like domain-containing protein n=1 Tax=unclassified Acidovorax TaxID=2684926 RepID=UPI00145E2807|nr:MULTISPECIES: rhodanese-like domain-containing protein [unclassified Acidovorax]NMM77160.1 sulfurtransferase [Acidovorax sp. SRB_24]NMM81337.1 sulfurtransferase [Acidovorax sp. SRB_14]NMM88888.1 sulfurtransferase [Rhodococcus sp. SRB_17]